LYDYIKIYTVNPEMVNIEKREKEKEREREREVENSTTLNVIKDFTEKSLPKA
jgi:hypothetical protein